MLLTLVVAMNCKGKPKLILQDDRRLPPEQLMIDKLLSYLPLLLTRNVEVTATNLRKLNLIRPTVDLNILVEDPDFHYAAVVNPDHNHKYHGGNCPEGPGTKVWLANQGKSSWDKIKGYTDDKILRMK
jgi:hypothetical protein